MVLTRLIDFGETPAAALAGPRFLLGKTFSDSRDSLKLESDVGAATLADLAGRGHELSPIEPQSPLAGLAGAIRIGGDGAVEGAHDPRGEGDSRGGVTACATRETPERQFSATWDLDDSIDGTTRHPRETTKYGAIGRPPLSPMRPQARIDHARPVC